MATVSAGALLSTIPLSFDSLHSPKCASPFFQVGVSRLVLPLSPQISPSNRETLPVWDSSLILAFEILVYHYALQLWCSCDLGVAAVAPLRHFGCPFCWELALALKESKATFDLAGVKLIAVGVGSPDKAQILAERLPFPMDCLYADPDRKVYNLLGLYYGIGHTFFNPAKVLTGFGALHKAVENYTIKGTPDDIRGIFQQGGMFVFRGKDLLYAWRDEGSGDHAPLDDISSICCKFPASRSR